MTTQRPVRTLPDHPDLAQLKRQAKDLLKAFVAGEHDAATEVHAHFRDAHVDAFALHDAQLVIARAYGFESWPRLKAFVDGATVRALCEAVRTGDLEGVRSMVTARPELVTMDLSENDERTALHVAVLHQRPAIVRLLVERGADPLKGIWPHRDATSALTIAIERGYDEIAVIIRDGAQRRSSGISASSIEPAASDQPPQRDANDVRAAMAAGDLAWLRAHLHPSTQSRQRRLVSHAVRVRRLDALTQLLDLGFDPDEKERVEGLDEVVWSWGEPLRECALSGQLAMATLLLERGANPNTNVYAASSAMSEALARNNPALVQVLERHGGVVDATTAGYLGLADRARQLLADAAVGVVAAGVVAPGDSVPRAMLESATDGGHLDIVRMALEHIDWPRGDMRWQGMLMRPFGRHTDADRDRYFDCFQLILDRSGVPIPLGRRSSLHDVAAAWPRSTMGPEERIGFATRLLDAGARLDVRDELLESTPLGWACRWGRLELVTLFLERGADPVERDAAPWATPLAWAEKMHHAAVASELRKHHGRGGSAVTPE